MPTTSWPCSARRAATTEESTPPDIAATTRFLADIARHLGQVHRQPVDLLADADLAAEARRRLETGGKVEHILFVLARSRQQIEELLLDDDVAGGAGQAALACAFDIDAVGK